MEKIKKQVQEILGREFPDSKNLSPGYLERGSCIQMQLNWTDIEDDMKFKFSYEITCDDTPQWLIDIHKVVFDRANELVKEDWLKFTLNRKYSYMTFPFPNSDRMFELRFFNIDEIQQALTKEDKLKIYTRTLTDY